MEPVNQDRLEFAKKNAEARKAEREKKSEAAGIASVAFPEDKITFELKPQAGRVPNAPSGYHFPQVQEETGLTILYQRVGKKGLYIDLDVVPNDIGARPGEDDIKHSFNFKNMGGEKLYILPKAGCEVELPHAKGNIKADHVIDLSRLRLTDGKAKFEITNITQGTVFILPEGMSVDNIKMTQGKDGKWSIEIDKNQKVQDKAWPSQFKSQVRTREEARLEGILIETYPTSIDLAQQKPEGVSNEVAHAAAQIRANVAINDLAANDVQVRGSDDVAVIAAQLGAKAAAVGKIGSTSVADHESDKPNRNNGLVANVESSKEPGRF